MKKQLFLGLTAFASLAVIAQNSNKAAAVANAKVKKAETMKYVIAEPSIFNLGSTSSNVANKASAAPYKRIGGSTNAFGVIVSESRCLQYNGSINTVGLVYRQNTNLWTGIPSGNSGTISYAWSSNNGSTWDSTVVAASSTQLHRYPCASIYNPAGNTSAANAYAVASGPWHPGANWQGIYLASKKLTAPGTNTVSSALYIDNLALTASQRKQDFSRVDPQTTADGVVHIVGQIYGDANGTTAATQMWRGAMINKGVFNAGAFTWTLDSLKPNFKLDNAGAKSGYTGTANMAWGEAGVIGYVIFYGVDANAAAGTPQNSFQPYVYKTTNSGATWSRYSALFNFTTISAVNDRLFPTKGVAGLSKPFITPSEGGSATVDFNGNLHLFATMNSASSDNLDSLGYSYSPNYKSVWDYLVDFKTTATGWDAIVVDSLNNAGPTAALSNWTGATNVAYDARAQISRTADGKNIFYSWADSDSSTVTSHVSTLPDIFMKGYDVLTNKITCKKNMTGNKTMASQAYFYFASPIVAKPTATSFLIPTSFVKSDDGTNNGDVAISQFYIDDNMFSATEFTVIPNTPGCTSGVGIKEIASTVSLLNFYPNPASSNGTIDVVLNENAKMDISIMNNVGQSVYTTSVAGNAGSNKVDVNLSNLSAGIYFYQVKIANSKSITKKFIVQK